MKNHYWNLLSLSETRPQVNNRNTTIRVNYIASNVEVKIIVQTTGLNSTISSKVKYMPNFKMKNQKSKMMLKRLSLH